MSTLADKLSTFPHPKNIWLQLLLAPVLGGAFVLFLPLAGFVLVGYAIVDAFRHEKSPRHEVSRAG